MDNGYNRLTSRACTEFAPFTARCPAAPPPPLAVAPPPTPPPERTSDSSSSAPRPLALASCVRSRVSSLEGEMSSQGRRQRTCLPFLAAGEGEELEDGDAPFEDPFSLSLPPETDGLRLGLERG